MRPLWILPNCEMLAELSEGVGRPAEPLQQWAVVDRVEDDLVVGPGVCQWIHCTRSCKRSLSRTWKRYSTPKRSISAWSWGGACTRSILDLTNPPVNAVEASHVLMVIVPSTGLAHFPPALAVQDPCKPHAGGWRKSSSVMEPRSVCPGALHVAPRAPCYPCCERAA